MNRIASLVAVLLASLLLAACGGAKEKPALTTTPEAKVDVRNILEGYMTLLVKNDPQICTVVSKDFFEAFTRGAYPSCTEFVAMNAEGGYDYSKVQVTDIAIDGGETLNEKTFEFHVEMATNDLNMFYPGFSLKVSASGEKWVLSDFVWDEDSHAEDGVS